MEQFCEGNKSLSFYLKDGLKKQKNHVRQGILLWTHAIQLASIHLFAGLIRRLSPKLTTNFYELRSSPQDYFHAQIAFKSDPFPKEKHEF